MTARTFASLSPLLALLSCVDASLHYEEGEPTAAITSHADGEVVSEGATLSVRGVAGHRDLGEKLLARWYAGAELVCGDEEPDAGGTTTCEFVVGGEDFNLSLEVRDSDNQATISPTGERLRAPAKGVYLER